MYFHALLAASRHGLIMNALVALLRPAGHRSPTLPEPDIPPKVLEAIRIEASQRGCTPADLVGQALERIKEGGNIRNGECGDGDGDGDKRMRFI